ncbi:MAG: response regulator [Myxococcota bacterium]|jgi:CheY-like chemotaxis protein|nr:response regulator [Myxococcota bacterium]
MFPRKTLSNQGPSWPEGAGLSFYQELNDEQEPSFTSGQAARLLGIPARTMRHYLSTGRVGGVQNPITGTWHISRSALFEFATARGHVPPPLQTALTVIVVERPMRVLSELARSISMHLPGCHLVRLSDVFDGLVQAAGLVPDLMVLDAEMPELPGEEMLRILKRNPRTAGIPLVAVTGRPEHRGRLTSAGANEVLLRTQSEEALRSMLVRLFPQQGQGGQRQNDETEPSYR